MLVAAALRIGAILSRQDVELLDAQPLRKPLPVGLHRKWARTIKWLSERELAILHELATVDLTGQTIIREM